MTERTQAMLNYWGTPEKALAMAQAQQKRQVTPSKELAAAIVELKKMAKKEAKR